MIENMSHDINICHLVFLFLGAINALKRKKRLEKQLTMTNQTLSSIEFQREALENARSDSEVLKSISYAEKALKSAHQILYEDYSFMQTIINCNQ